MKKTPLWIFVAIVVLLLDSSLLWNFSMRAADAAGRGAKGQVAADNRAKENFDIRNKESEEAVSKFERRMEKLSSKQKEKNADFKLAMETARERKARSVRGLEVTFCNLTNSPEVVQARGGGRKFLTPSSKQPRESVLRGFINDNGNLFGMSAQQVARLRKTAEYTNPNGKLSWLRMEQRWNGMKVFRGEMVAAFTRDGEMVRTIGELTAGPEEQELPTVPEVSAAAAVVVAAASVDVTVTESDLVVKKSSPNGGTAVFGPAWPFTGDIELELQYFPLDTKLATLAWSMVLWQGGTSYYTLIDAGTGELLWRKNITDYQTQPATYAVYDGDSPAPLSPTTALPGSGIQGAAIPRTLFMLISELPAFNNLGWLTDGVNTTTGNNVDAGLDLVAPNGIDVDGRPTGSPDRVFDFNYNPAPGIPPPGDSPTLADYRFGEVVNMFFWSNRYHDRLYELGFTEAARNFQQDNFGRGGFGNDRVLAQAQDFFDVNNANFSTPPDGTSGSMQMLIFNGPNPDRSSGLDQEILIHELTHGTSNRLHSNAFGLMTIMSRGMGEGWSDFYALSLLSQPGDDPHGIYAVGGYSTLQIDGGFTDNYYYGIRRFPHATISTVGPNGKPHNPLTFADIDPTQINLTDGAFPRGPGGSANAFQVHNIGEVWCAALWEVRARIIDRMGFAGNQRTLQLVTDGMKLDPFDPTLLDGRNSILAASCAAFDGEDELDIWRGFAARGMGFSARATSSSSSSVVEAFDIPNLNIGSVTISADSCAPPDGFADPGESLLLGIPLSNPFCATPANGVTVSVEGGSAVSYGDLPAGATASRDAPFTVPTDAACGSQLPVAVTITSSLGTVTRTFNLQIGRLVGSRNYSSGNIAVSLSSLTRVDIPINVTDAGVVGDVNVKVRLNYNRNDALEMTLIGPDGTSVALARRGSASGENLGAGANDCSGVSTVFDDSASIAIGDGTAPFAGSFRPDSPLSAFNGKPRNGVWTLSITGVAPNLNFGTLGCVQLEIASQRFACCGVPGTPEVQAAPPVTVVSESCAPGNGAPDPDETVTVNFPLLNIGAGNTTNLVATLLPGGGVLAPSGPQDYGVLIPDGPAVARPFTFTAAGACGGNITATLALRDGSTNLGTVAFTIRIGAVVTSTSSFSNTASIRIPATGVGALNGAPSNPYPSTINVSGVTGTVSKVTVQLFRYGHVFTADVDVLLVGPGGQKLLLMSDVGLSVQLPPFISSGGGDLTFDDAGPPMPIIAKVISGTYKPTNDGTGDLFPAPAPPGPYPDPQQLSVFNGVNPNGTWSLFVVDGFPHPQADGEGGSISGGWRLNITTTDPVCPTTTVSTVTGQFSDVAMLKANVTNVICSGSGSVEFRVNGSIVGSAPVVNGTATVPYKISLAQGSYPITATYTTQSSGAGRSGSGALTVTTEDAIVTPVASNPTAVQVSSRRGASGPIKLCAAITETNDESLGDIALATPLTFTLTPVAPGTQPITQTATTSGGGVGGTLTACAALNNVPVNVYDVGVSVGGNNYTGSGGASLAVFDPSLGAFKGVGTIVRNGRPSTFLFNVKYRKNGSPQGGLLYAERRPTGFLILQASAVQSLSVIGNTGVMFGNARVNGVANHTFRATVVDGGKSARNDRFGLQVISPSGAVIADLTFDPIALRGGNIKR
jgi:subtilisin-like proprotein convertase family protein